jgi:hypothetical protein
LAQRRLTSEARAAVLGISGPPAAASPTSRVRDGAEEEEGAPPLPLHVVTEAAGDGDGGVRVGAEAAGDGDGGGRS